MSGFQAAFFDGWLWQATSLFCVYACFKRNGDSAAHPGPRKHKEEKTERQQKESTSWCLLSFSRVLGKNCGSSYPHFFITAYVLCLHYFSIEAFHSIQQCTEQKMCKDKGRRHKLQNLTCPMYYSLAATLTKLPLQVHKQPASNATQSPAKKSANFDSRVEHCPWGIIVSIDVLGENGSVRPPCSLPHPIATWGSCRWNETLM